MAARFMLWSPWMRTVHLSEQSYAESSGYYNPAAASTTQKHTERKNKSKCLMFVWKYEHIDKSLWFCIIRLIGCSATEARNEPAGGGRESAKIRSNSVRMKNIIQFYRFHGLSNGIVSYAHTFLPYSMWQWITVLRHFFSSSSFVRLFVHSGCRRFVLEFVRFQTNLHIKLTMTTNDQHGHWAVHSIHILHVIFVNLLFLVACLAESSCSGHSVVGATC